MSILLLAHTCLVDKHIQMLIPHAEPWMVEDVLHCGDTPPSIGDVFLIYVLSVINR